MVQGKAFQVTSCSASPLQGIEDYTSCWVREGERRWPIKHLCNDIALIKKQTRKSRPFRYLIISILRKRCQLLFNKPAKLSLVFTYSKHLLVLQVNHSRQLITTQLTPPRWDMGESCKGKSEKKKKTKNNSGWDKVVSLINM